MKTRMEGRTSSVQNVTHKLNDAEWRGFLSYMHVATVHSDVSEWLCLSAATGHLILNFLFLFLFSAQHG